MSELPECPQCGSAFTYEDRSMFVCPECGNEWSSAFEPVAAAADTGVVDCNGNTLSDGDTVAVIKDLKVKGSSVVIKVGTRVKNIRLAEGDHDIDCRMPRVGALQLKSQFVKKV